MSQPGRKRARKASLEYDSDDYSGEANGTASQSQSQAQTDNAQSVKKSKQLLQDKQVWMKSESEGLRTY